MSSGEIILCSSGQCAPGVAKRLKPGAAMAFIRTAAMPEADRSWLEAEREVFVRAGLEVIDIDVLDEAARRALCSSDMVFLGGGNTFYLLAQLRESGFDRLLKELHSKGKLIIGESAGALVLGPTIEPVRYIDDPARAPGLRDFSGLNLISFFPAVHFCREEYAAQYQDILQHVFLLNLAVLALRDRDFAVVSGDRLELRTA